MPRPAAAPPELVAERKRRRSGKASTAAMSRELKIATMTAFNFGDGVKWLLWLKTNKPALFVELLKKCMTPDDLEGDTNITFVVQQVAINGAPIPGVTNSPIASHVATPRISSSQGEVIDAEVRSG